MINNLPKAPKQGGSFVPAYRYAGDGATSTTSSTPNVCTVSGDTVNFIAAGTCALTAHAAEGTYYRAADGRVHLIPTLPTQIFAFAIDNSQLASPLALEPQLLPKPLYPRGQVKKALNEQPKGEKK